MKKYFLAGVIWSLTLTSFGQDKAWWKETVVYQVYPQSFKDSDGDGIGDLKGIFQKLDYLQQLGVGTIWINPIYKSPGYDNGYDISDYRSINPVYGSMADFEQLLAAIKKRKMHLVMDMVLNHTSDEHIWFQEAKSSRTNRYHDYYIWKDGKKENVPNNWPSIFGGSAWNWNEATGEYYLHTFLDRQPDLNWDNPKVRQELYKVMRFWLDKGVDGFRLDAISVISKNREYPAMNYTNGFFAALNGKMNNGPHLHEYLHEMNDEVFSRYNMYAVGEVFTNKDSAWEYVSPDRKELSAIHFFDVLQLSGPGSLVSMKKIMNGWNNSLQHWNSWNTVMLTNHDFPRAVSRMGNDKDLREESAKMLATFQLTYRGTPFIYQGEELGMTNFPFRNISEVNDVTAHNQYAEMTGKQGLANTAAFNIIKNATRDNARTPFQWDDSYNAGFTVYEKPWLSVNPNCIYINAKKEMADSGSIFQYYQKLILLRKTHSDLIYGSMEDISPGDSTFYVFTRTNKQVRWLIILNLTNHQAIFGKPVEGKLVLSNHDNLKSGKQKQLFQPYESRIYEIHLKNN